MSKDGEQRYRWKYDELLQGRTHIAYVLDGERVVCQQETRGIEIRSRRIGVERTRREFRMIVEQQAENERLQADRDRYQRRFLDAQSKLREWQEYTGFLSPSNAGDEIKRLQGEVERLQAEIKCLRDEMVIDD